MSNFPTFVAAQVDFLSDLPGSLWQSNAGNGKSQFSIGILSTNEEFEVGIVTQVSKHGTIT